MARPTSCTCGECYTGEDAYGNVDYGQSWDDCREDYVPRDCPVAREASRLEISVEQMQVEGRLR